MDTIQFEWMTTESDVPAVRERVIEEGGTIEREVPFTPTADDVTYLGDSSFDPVTVLAASLAIGGLIRVLSEVTLDHRHPGGAVVDLRDGDVLIQEIRSLRPGELVLVTDAGTEVYEPQQRTDALDQLRTALTGVIAGG